METWAPGFVIGLAEAATGCKGYEALRQFSKQLVVGAARDAGDERMEEVFARPLVALYGVFGVLTHLAFANDADRFRWLFLSEPWLLDPMGWEAAGCDALVLVGMDGDAKFFFVPMDEALSVLQDSDGAVVLTMPTTHPLLARWADMWANLRGGFANAATENG